MPHFTTGDGLHLLFLAKASEIGFVLRTNDPRRLAACLRQAMKLPEAQGAELEDLQIRLSPFAEGDLIVVNRHIKIGQGLPPAPTEADILDEILS